MDLSCLGTTDANQAEKIITRESVQVKIKLSNNRLATSAPVLVFNSRKGTDALKRALWEEGCRLVEDCWEPGTLAATQPDAIILDFYEAVRHLRRTFRLKHWASHNGIRVVVLDRDAPWHRGVKNWRLRLFGILKLADIYATHSLQGAEQFAPQVEYFPNAANIADYNLAGRTLADLRQADAYRYDVSFIGNLNAARYPEHAERAAFFRALEPRLRERGVRCLFADSAGMSVAQQVEVIQNSKMNINYGAACDSRGERSWGLPERCYGVPACGGFLLSDKREHASMDFTPQTEWADFVDLDDCVKRIGYYLEHFSLARQIAEAAHQRVMQQHTYRNRARQLMQRLDLNSNLNPG